MINIERLKKETGCEIMKENDIFCVYKDGKKLSIKWDDLILKQLKINHKNFGVDFDKEVEDMIIKIIKGDN